VSKSQTLAFFVVAIISVFSFVAKVQKMVVDKYLDVLSQASIIISLEPGMV